MLITKRSSALPCLGPKQKTPTWSTETAQAFETAKEQLVGVTLLAFLWPDAPLAAFVDA